MTEYEDIKMQMEGNITARRPILMWNDLPLIYQRTINIVQGKTGVHKSRFTETMAAALMATDDDHEKRCYLHRPPEQKPVMVMHLDTERNKWDQLPYAMQKMCWQSGYPHRTVAPDLFTSTLADIPRKERPAAIEQLVKHFYKEEGKKHFVVILDVVSDCMGNFNDAFESMELIDKLGSMILNYNVSFILVIHENPGESSKARGHLGTELGNKSSIVLKVDLEKMAGNPQANIINIKNIKNRNTAPLPDHLLYYCPHDHHLKLCDDSMQLEATHRKGRKATITEVASFLLKALWENCLPREQVLTELAANFEISKRTAHDRLKEVLEGELSLKSEMENDQAKYQIIKTKVNNLDHYKVAAIA